MKAQKKPAPPSTASYNDAIWTAYQIVTRQAESLLASLERDELRHVFERTGEGAEPHTIIHEMVPPVLYLRLQVTPDSGLAIHFGLEPAPHTTEVQTVTTAFLRALFLHTGRTRTGPNSEGCVTTDWFINVCSSETSATRSGGFHSRCAPPASRWLSVA